MCFLTKERRIYEEQMRAIAAEKEEKLKHFLRLQEELKASSSILETKSVEMEMQLANMQREREKMMDEVGRLEIAKREAESKGTIVEQVNERLLQLQTDIRTMDGE